MVPPDILNQPDANNAAQEEGVSNEGGTIQLACSATGVPEPTVQWRREGGKDIVLRSDGKEKQGKKSIFYILFSFLVQAFFSTCK